MADATTTSARQGIRKGRLGRLLRVLSECFSAFLREDSLMLSASIAYYGLLGIFPFLLLLLGISGIYISRFELNGTLAVILDRYLPMKPDFILRNLVNISNAYGRVGMASFILLLVASSGIFVPIEKALNRAWQVTSGRRWLRSRVLALEFSVIFGLFFVLFSGLVGLNLYIRHWARLNIQPRALPWFGLFYSCLGIAVTFGITLGILMILFIYLPNRPLRAKQVLPGTLVTALLWELSRIGFTLLLKHFNYRHVYGSIGAMVALMTWAYVSAAVLLFGARISQQLYIAMYPQNASDADPLPSPVEEASSK